MIAGRIFELIEYQSLSGPEIGCRRPDRANGDRFGYVLMERSEQIQCTMYSCMHALRYVDFMYRVQILSSGSDPIINNQLTPALDSCALSGLNASLPSTRSSDL